MINHLRLVYVHMVSRCTNPSDKAYRRYGGRGIGVCDEWLHNKEAFYFWAKTKWQKGLQIDRIDNNKGYSPDNCRFVSPQDNIRNSTVTYPKELRSRVFYLTRYRLKISEIARKIGISRPTVYAIIKEGIPDDTYR